MEFIRLHTSGHAPISTLKKMVDKVGPGTIIPIHTEHAGDYREIFGDRVRLLSDREEFEVK